MSGETFPDNFAPADEEEAFRELARRPVDTLPQRRFDHTVLDVCQRCEQEAVFRFRHHLESGRPDAARLFGQAVHAGLRAFYDAPSEPEAHAAATAAAWGDAVFEDPREYRTLGYAQLVVQAYAVEYPPAKWDFDLVMNERYLEDESECGIVDRVVRRKVDRQLYVRDLKTTGLWLSPAWQEQWRHSQQAATYIKLAEHALGEPIAGFWCDAIHLDRRGVPKAEHFVAAGPFPYSAALRAELAAQRALQAERARAVLEGSVAPLKRTSNCFRYNRACAFLRFCAADPADRADMVELAVATGELVQHEWRPKERDT